MDTYQQLRVLAEGLGVAGFGVTSAEPFNGVAETIKARREAGLGGKLQFTYKQPDVAADVQQSFAGAESIVVVSWSYMPAAGSPGAPAPGQGRIARFATEDHYRGLCDALTQIQQHLVAAGWKAEVLVDDDRLVDRAAAVRAGIGWWGKSSMVLDPRHGPWLLLGAVVTDAPLPVSEPMSRDCGTCDACIPACPTGAIVAPGVLDASLCLAHWLQMPGTIPIELREAVGNRVYGCDDCLEACPPGWKRLVDVPQGLGHVDLLSLLAADDQALLKTYDHFYIPRRRPRNLRRNAIVALANSTALARSDGGIDADGISQVIAVLAGYLGHPDGIYRSHAAWGLGRIGGPTAEGLLRYQAARERDDSVATEIRSARANVAKSSTVRSTLHPGTDSADTGSIANEEGHR